MSRPIYASINVDALQHNLEQVRKCSPSSKIMAIVKANAYGHGLILTCKSLKNADTFGLLDLSDALALRNAGVQQPICLLEGFFSAEELPLIIENSLQTVIHSMWQIDALQHIGADTKLTVWLKVDTGMQRLGFTVDEYEFALKRLSEMKCVNNIKLLSHLANADIVEDAFTAQQLSKFLALSDVNSHEKSLANSAGVLSHKDCHLDWVRPGIMLYGSSPFPDKTAENLNLRPVMSLKAEIIAIKNCKRGDAVGYGGKWCCPEDMKIAVVACGYGDGYPRHAPSGTPLLVAGKITQLIGRVSMDMITVDLRGIEKAKIGSPVELWGSSVSIDTVAEMSGTISYELLCGITQRVKRQEIHNGKS